MAGRSAKRQERPNERLRRERSESSSNDGDAASAAARKLRQPALSS